MRILFLIFVLVLSACGNGRTFNPPDASTSDACVGSLDCPGYQEANPDDLFSICMAREGAGCCNILDMGAAYCDARREGIEEVCNAEVEEISTNQELLSALSSLRCSRRIESSVRISREHVCRDYNPRDSDYNFDYLDCVQ